MNVVHVAFSLEPGGLERVVLDLLRAGQSLGQNAAVVCLDRRGPLAEEAEAMGVKVVCLDKPPGLRPSTVARAARALARLRPDVVHTHQIGALLYAGPAARAAGVPAVVHTEHGKHYARRFRTRLVGRLAGRFATRFFCVSDDIAAEVRANRVVPPGKVHTLGNGIDLSRFDSPAGGGPVRTSCGIPREAPVIGTVGRLCEVKRQDVLIRAFARLRLGGLPDAHLLIVGDGPARSDLRVLAAGLGLCGSIHFVGHRPDPIPYLRAMDVFTLTSRSEGMPLVVLEAWAAGVPVAATRVGGLPELIDSGQTGLLFPPGDDAAAAEAFGAILADDALACRLRTAGGARVRSAFSLERMAKDYHRHYLAVLGPDKPVHRTPAAAAGLA